MASAESRVPDSKKFLDRPTLHNPKGGFLSASGGEDHAYEADKSLNKVDAMRRYEFLRRKANMDTDEETDNKHRIDDIRRNLGWPFSIGVISITEEYEMGWEGVPVCNYCGASHMEVKQCSVCKAVAYCDEKCQLAHWPTHEKECPELEKKRLLVYTPEDKLLPKDEIDAKAREDIALKARSATILGEPVFFDSPKLGLNETETGIPGIGPEILKWKRGLMNIVIKPPKAVEDKKDQATKGAGEGQTDPETSVSGNISVLSQEQTVAEIEAGNANRKDVATSRGETREPGASGVYWDGPESKLGILDLLVSWKPLIVCA